MHPEKFPSLLACDASIHGGDPDEKFREASEPSSTAYKPRSPTADHSRPLALSWACASSQRLLADRAPVETVCLETFSDRLGPRYMSRSAVGVTTELASTHARHFPHAPRTPSTPSLCQRPIRSARWWPVKIGSLALLLCVISSRVILLAVALRAGLTSVERVRRRRS